MAVPVQYRAKQKNEMAERRRTVASLLAKRATQAEIAQALGVSERTISRDVEAIRAAWLEDTKKDAEIFISRELAELEDMDRDAALRQEEGSWFDRRLRVKERKAKMVGIDKQRYELTGKDGGPIDFSDARSALLAAIIGITNGGSEESGDPEPTA